MRKSAAGMTPGQPAPQGERIPAGRLILNRRQTKIARPSAELLLLQKATIASRSDPRASLKSAAEPASSPAEVAEVKKDVTVAEAHSRAWPGAAQA